MRSKTTLEKDEERLLGDTNHLYRDRQQEMVGLESKIIITFATSRRRSGRSKEQDDDKGDNG